MMGLAAALMLCMGLLLGLLGGGGSILAVPILLHVMGLAPAEAIAASQLVVSLSAVSALLPHARGGRIRWRAGLVFAAVSGVMAYLAGLVSAYVSGELLLGIFVAFMLVTAVMMLRGRRAPSPSATHVSLALVAGNAAAVGALSGLVGAGGGFLIVPALVVMGRMAMQDAVGTSLLVISINAGLGFVAHLGHVRVELAQTFALAGVGAVGAFVGATLCARVSAASLRRGFGVLVLVVGVATAYGALPASIRAAAFEAWWPLWLAFGVSVALAGALWARASKDRGAGGE